MSSYMTEMNVKESLINTISVENDIRCQVNLFRIKRKYICDNLNGATAKL